MIYKYVQICIEIFIVLQVLRFLNNLFLQPLEEGSDVGYFTSIFSSFSSDTPLVSGKSR